MPIGDFFRVLRRRWVVVLVGFLLTVGLSGAAYWFFKPTYEITGTVLLLPPASSAVNGSTNPYLQLGGLQQTVDLVGVSLTDQAATLEMQTISKDVEFTVKADVRTSSPLLVVDVKTSSPETALKIRDILVARVPVRLDELQQSLNVSTKDRVTSKVLTLDTEAQEVGRNRLRAGVVAGVLGIGLTLVVAALWDASRLRHPRRRAPARLATASDDAASPPAETPPVAADADLTSVEYDLPPMEANLPPVEYDLPSVEANLPPGDFSASLVETDLPETQPFTPVPSEEALPLREAVVPPTEPSDAAQGPLDAFEGIDDPADVVVGAPVSPSSPSRVLEALEEGADASDDAPR